MVTLGQNLLPIALEVATALNGMLEKFNNMSPAMQKAILVFAGFVAVMGPVISAIGTLISAGSAIAGFVGSLSGAGAILGTIGAGISAAGAALGGVAVSALAAIGPIWLIIATLGALYWAFKNDFGGIMTTAKQLWFLIKYGFAEMWKSLKKGTSVGLENLRESWDAWIENNQERFQRWGAWIKNAWQRVLDYFAQIRDRIVQTFQRMDWAQVGKNVLMGLANGMLLGIPGMVAAAIKAGKAALSAFDKVMDNGSPSKEMQKRGVWSTQGYIQGMRKISPMEIANALAKPALQSATNNRQEINMQFSSGLTVRQAQAMISANNEELLKRLNYSLEF